MELEKALSEIKVLRGILPICSNCKKIRDDKGYWQDVAVYIRDHSEADFSHGICPDCIQELYPEQYDMMESRRQSVLTALTELTTLKFLLVIRPMQLISSL